MQGTQVPGVKKLSFNHKLPPFTLYLYNNYLPYKTYDKIIPYTIE